MCVHPWRLFHTNFLCTSVSMCVVCIGLVCVYARRLSHTNFLWMNVFACAWFIQVYVCARAWKPAVNFQCCSLGVVTLFLRKGLSLALNSLNRQGWLTRTQRSACFHSPALGVVPRLGHLSLHLFMYKCMQVCPCRKTVWRPDNKVWKSVLSHCLVGSRDQTCQVGGKHLNLLS